MVASSSIIADDALPQLHEAANEASSEGQKNYKQLTRVRLWLVVIAAALGVTSWRVGADEVDLLALLAVIVFGGALLVELHLSRTRPDRAWYDGRAVAESAKTLAWKYSVCADPFPVTLDTAEATSALISELDTIRARYPNLQLAPAIGAQVTTWMRETRNSPYNHRQAVYLDLRLLDQQKWYRTKSKEFKRSASKWRWSLIGFELLGVGLSLVGALSTFDLAFTPIVAAVIAAAVGWIQIQQYDQLAEAYSTAVADLASAYTKVAQAAAEEEKWALEVNDAEEAMSREHTLWSAKRSQLY